jgi:hypothetical protein
MTGCIFFLKDAFIGTAFDWLVWMSVHVTFSLKIKTGLKILIMD